MVCGQRPQQLPGDGVKQEHVAVVAAAGHDVVVRAHKGGLLDVCHDVALPHETLQGAHGVCGRGLQRADGADAVAAQRGYEPLVAGEIPTALHTGPRSSQ